MISLIAHAARTIVAIGAPVFPVHDKRPAIAGGRGHHDATTNHNELDALFGKAPKANGYGVACGATLPNGHYLVVLDYDDKNGAGKSERKLVEQIGPLPRTKTTQTPGGKHEYYQSRTKVSRMIGLLPGIDVLGDGYAVGPGSKRTDGGSYVEALNWATTPIADFPHELLDLIANRRKQNINNVLPDEFKSGARNIEMFTTCRLMHGQGLKFEEVHEAAKAINKHRCRPPLQSSEILSIVKSSENYSSSSSPDIWLAPEPLPSGLLPIAKLSADLLPSDLLPWLADIAARSQVPLELPSIPAMIGLASIVGRRIGIRPKRSDDWTVIPNLYGIVVYPPGMLKSPSAAAGLAPLQALEDMERNRHAELVATVNVDRLIREEHRKSLIKKLKTDHGNEIRAELIQLEQKDDAPTRKRYIVADATPEALHTILAENPAGVLMYRDEMAALFKTMAREERSQERELLLSAWGGDQSFPVDRIKRGAVFARTMCLSLCGTIQPAPLLRLVRSEVELGDGLIQRLQLAVWPDIDKNVAVVDTPPNTEAKQRAIQLFDRLNQLPIPEGKTVPYLRFDDKAQQIFDDWYLSNEKRIRSGELELPGFQAHLGKFRSLVPSLALLLHLASGGHHKEGTLVGERAIVLALAWATFLEDHARRIFGRAAESHLDHAGRLLRIIERGGRQLDSICDNGGIEIRRMYRGSRTWKRDSAKQAAETLVAYGWLRETRIGQAVRFEINPQVRHDTLGVVSVVDSVSEGRDTPIDVISRSYVCIEQTPIEELTANHFETPSTTLTKNHTSEDPSTPENRIQYSARATCEETMISSRPELDWSDWQLYTELIADCAEPRWRLIFLAEERLIELADEGGKLDNKDDVVLKAIEDLRTAWKAAWSR